jgi:branched-chain amino acid aminotransferase
MCRDWIPEGEGYSLYLRPTVIATWPYLGVNAARSFKLYCIACPVGPYYPEGFKPVRLLAETGAVRAWPGGVGAAKVGGNYAPTIKVQAAAAKKGYSQVLWLFGEGKEVTEVGTMNFFVFWINEAGEKELVTAPLDGTILEGVTRQSILDLGREWKDFKVSERKFTMHDIVKASKEKRLLEAFGAGTAAVVSPVKQIHFDGVDYDIPVDASAGAGPLTKRFWNSLLDIQYGKAGDHPWSVKI